MKEFPKRFLSIRDKSGTHNRSRSVPAGAKNRPFASDTFKSVFKSSEARQAAKDEQLAAKIEDVQNRLERMKITSVSDEHIKDILSTASTEGDPEKAVQFIDIEQKALAGIIEPYDPAVHMVGAENRSFVTCYLDALLFSMFARLDAFECMLKNDFPSSDSRSELVILLRIWVNMLRTGKLIHTDLVALIQNALAKCGWADAALLEQQDTSEAFAFLTETLQLPLLSLQVDLFHHGKGDKDDHKVVYERLLNLAVPPDPEGKGIRLEDCLEEYFNTRVDVMRDSEVAKKSIPEDSTVPNTPSSPATIKRSSLRVETSGGAEGSVMVSSSPMDISPPPLLPHQHSSPNVGLANVPNDQSGSASGRRPSARARSASVIQQVLIDEKGRASSTDDTSTLQNARRKGSVIVKAVTIPAWQFFRLIPWHALTNSEPKSNSEVALNFEQRPVVGICLKRYLMTETGQPIRHNTYIDIPDSLRLPRFMIADDCDTEEDLSVFNMDYKLVLQSVVCHRGVSLQSGHYISFARVAPKVLKGNRRHKFDPPPDYEEARWVRFDDLELDRRVTYVDDIKECLRVEMPYLLFYQVVPTMDVASSSAYGTETGPPSYNESKTSLDLSQTSARRSSDISRPESPTQVPECYEGLLTTDQHAREATLLSSSWRSAEGDGHFRKSMEYALSGNHSGSLNADSRRPSIIYTDSTAPTPEPQSPLIGPSDETTASRLSRAASRFTKAKYSRPESASGEGRISITMNRLGGLMRQSKEPLAEPTAMNISAPHSPDPSDQTAITTQVVEVPQEKDTQHLQVRDARGKSSHKRGKSKDKTVKEKAGSQPERECTVM